jgi:hypothetical protein
MTKCLNEKELNEKSEKLKKNKLFKQHLYLCCCLNNVIVDTNLLPQEIIRLIILFAIDPNDIQTNVSLYKVIRKKKMYTEEQICKLDTSCVTSMRMLFIFDYEFDQCLNSWDVSNVENMSLMFCGCKKLNKRFDKWNVENVLNFEAMFSDCRNLNQSFKKWKINPKAKTKNIFNNCIKMQGTMKVCFGTIDSVS